jgi:cytochrome c-type biogenesis protein CcmH
MKGILLPVAGGLALALLALGVVAALRPADASPAARADALAAELRCPDCQGLSVADSSTAAAREIRRQIGELVGAGASDAEVRDRFVARYGEWILLAPTSPAAWVLPFAAVLLAGAGLAAWIVRRRPATAAPAPSLSDEARRRLHDEAEAIDA